MTNPSSLTDTGFRQLKCETNLNVPGCVPQIQENWVAEWKGPTGTNQTSNQWSINDGCVQGSPPTTCWGNGGGPNGQPSVRGVNYTTQSSQPFKLKYNSVSQLIEWTLGTSTICNTTSPPSVSACPPPPISGIFDLTRGPSINSLYLRVSGSGANGPQLKNITITDLSTNQITSIGSLLSGSSAQYAIVNGIPGSFEVNGTYVAGSAPIGNWQIKAVYTPPSQAVPGPLPVIGAAAAFGYSRKLRKRLRQAQRHPQITD